MDKSSDRGTHFKYYIAASVSLITFLIYLKSLQNDFVWDDNLYVVDNPYIHSFDLPFFKWSFFDFYAANWHPLTWISHAVDYAMWGLNPLGHHLTNNILHALCTFIVVLLAMRLMEVFKKIAENKGLSRSFLDDRAIGMTAAVTGLLFGLHPLHAESVAWVAERKDLLCAVFFLLSVTAYAHYMGEISENAFAVYTPRLLNKRYLLTLGLFTLALLSKPMAVTLPFVLLILDWYPFGRIRSIKTLWAATIEKLPFLALTLISSILTVLAQKAGGAMEPMKLVPLSMRLLVAARSLIAYLGKMILPLNLSPYYAYPDDISPYSLEYIVPIALVAGITITFLTVLRNQKLWMAVWGYYVITLLPVLGIVQVGGQSMADRYTYLQSIGPFLLIGLIAAKVYADITDLTRWRVVLKTAGLVLAAAALVSMSYATMEQIGVWRNSFVFWGRVLEAEPARIPFAYNNLGLAYASKGQLDEAIELYQTALRLKPDYAEAHNNLGIAYASKGQLEMAIEQFQTAVRLKPDYAEAHNDLGLAYASKGLLDEAIEHYQTAVRLKPDLTEAHFNLGLIYLKKGSKDMARTEFELVVRNNPDDHEARRILDSIISQ